MSDDNRQTKDFHASDVDGFARMVDGMAAQLSAIRQTECIVAHWVGGGQWEELSPEAIEVQHLLHTLQGDINKAQRRLSDLLIKVVQGENE